jgi:hypothetical protein
VNKIAQMTKDRAGIFSEAADRKNVADAIIEKDFWVCWVLKQLFSIEALSNRLMALNTFESDVPPLNRKRDELPLKS